MPRLAALTLCGLLLLTACDHGSPTKGGTDTSKGTIVADLRLEPVPSWMEGYCHKAADDLGYAVLCPVRLPSWYDIVPCKGPTPKNELWGKYCFDYVLDSVFKGPPGYQGPFAANRRAGHLAIWTIAPTSDMYQGGLFGCPEGGLRKESARLRGHSGHWWACPATRVANLNSGHVAFQWFAGGVIYGVSVHGINDVNRRIVRELLDYLDLVGPQSPRYGKPGPRSNRYSVVTGAAPVGSRGDLPLSELLSRREKYCHNGGMAFAHHHGVGLPGSTMAIMAPSGVLENCWFSGEKPQGPGVRALWGQRWTRLPAFA